MQTQQEPPHNGERNSTSNSESRSNDNRSPSRILDVTKCNPYIYNSHPSHGTDNTYTESDWTTFATSAAESVCIILGSTIIARPCTLCGATDHTNTLHKNGFMNVPCLCCGSEDHKMLQTLTNDLGKKITEYECPIVIGERYFTLSKQLAQNHIKYAPSAEKFARHYGFDTNNIEQASILFYKNGHGRFMTPKKERSNWTFKRDQSLSEISDTNESDDSTMKPDDHDEETSILTQKPTPYNYYEAEDDNKRL
jgi:hypothetical protein